MNPTRTLHTLDCHNFHELLEAAQVDSGESVHPLPSDLQSGHGN
ncbi:hypothetical protein [Streptomyces phaeofaciens]|nr:hypothetical protein [Streptomyces phaeofaciens]